MKVLFAASAQPDYQMACLWDGLQEVLGPENVYDAADAPYLHQKNFPHPAAQIAAHREYDSPLYVSFDLMIVSTSFLKDGKDWHWPLSLLSRLKKNAKIALLEGWDSAHEVHDPRREAVPPLVPDAVFRREIDPGFAYPYEPHHLGFAAPMRWFHEPTIFGRAPQALFAGNVYPERGQLLDLLRAPEPLGFPLLVMRGLPQEGCLAALWAVKIALCPSGAERSDCLRTYEAVSQGAVPLFIDYPPWRREPWFGVEHCFSVDASVNLANFIPDALEQMTDYMSKMVFQHAREHHTTKARAEKVLSVLRM
jgi:hypothetical protein